MTITDEYPVDIDFDEAANERETSITFTTEGWDAAFRAMKRLFPKFDTFEQVGLHLQSMTFGDAIRRPQYQPITARNTAGASGSFISSGVSNSITWTTSANYARREPSHGTVHPEIVQIDRDEMTRTYSIRYRLQEFPNTIYTVKIADEIIARQAGSLSQDSVLSAMEQLIWTEVSKMGRLVQG